MKVFIDSNIIRHAATRYRTQTIQFGQLEPGDPLVKRGPIQLHSKKPHDHPGLRSEIRRLRELSAQLKVKNATLLMDQETLGEVKMAGGFRGEYFYRSNIIVSDPPLKYDRIIGLPRHLNPGPTENHFHNFLSRLEHPRFIQLAKATGGLQGTTSKHYNQLADAFFLWCAEHNEADYFLTLDSKLKRCVGHSGNLGFLPAVVLPTELLSVLLNT
ncbi:hypothetical protein LVB87_11545 [Lysobacter sp. KIS68-7]|uniref:hypothetical protein n=1 Tax=Lysobacter sp. KIS68-7 TaxID=2904252 RepID=UPI001E5CFD7D|nr:hypothetical protein [Lysobacter sp. KIS68-7]UHQ18815.1 hypothetical protein LVB87_11545 [Lysobacter sp. KIS68-7]